MNLCAPAALLLAIVGAVASSCVTKNADLDAVDVDVAAREITGLQRLTGDAAERARSARALREQGNHQAALIAFRLAEDAAPGTEKPHLQLEQATTLRLMAMPGAALELLTPLASSADPDVRQPALALAGAVYGEQDDLTRAESLLREAVRGDDRWPGQAAAQHDLGVVLLRRGDERGGIEMLRRARERHLRDGNEGGAAAACLTEAAYWRIEGSGETAERLMREAERLGAVR